MRYVRNPMQTDLCRRSFDGVHGAQQAVNLLFAGTFFQSKKALGGNLQMLFCFRNKELKDLSGNLVIIWNGLRRNRVWRNRLRFNILSNGNRDFLKWLRRQWRRRYGNEVPFLLRLLGLRLRERKWVTLFEYSYIVCRFHSCAAD